MTEGDIFNKNSMYMGYYFSPTTPSKHIFVFTPHEDCVYSTTSYIDTDGIFALYMNHLMGTLDRYDRNSFMDYCYPFYAGCKEIFELSNDESLDIVGGFL
jgi:hypothetical protein